ncbi:MAG: hypothetical protein KBE91_08475 [Bacteroidia bacterium]|nr:hypothetical protein [Bacteroidia bacterium]MBP9689631.1 hypothetical protein [Bacteroidia bacterium]
MNLKYGVQPLFLVLFMMAFSLSSSSQNSRSYSYDEDDYDGDYEYNNNYYERYSEDEYRKRQEKAYKKSYNEEELYNGGYRRKSTGSYDNQSGYSGGFNIGGVGTSSSKSSSWFGSDNSESTPSKPRNIEQFDTREVGEIRGIDKLGGNGDGVVDKNFNPIDGKEIDPKDRKQDDVPPPPDEPDIPIDTAIPVLIFAGLLIATTKITKIKNALV